MSSSVLVGAAEKVIEVPLFAELGGYGPFRGRRNIGVRDPLYCRVLTVNDGCRRNVIVITDMIASSQLHSRVLRMDNHKRIPQKHPRRQYTSARLQKSILRHM